MNRERTKKKTYFLQAKRREYKAMGKSFKKELEVSTAKKLIKEAQEPQEVKAEPAGPFVEPIKEEPKASPKETLSIRLNLLTKPSTRERLKKYCEANYISLNEYINRLVEEDLNNKGI